MFYNFYQWLMTIPPRIHWRKKRLITEEEKKEIAKLLSTGYYIILTGDKGHLSSLLVSIAQFVKLGKWSRYSHALMNCDFVDDASKSDQFKFLEATSIGVHYSSFDEVFNCDYVCLLTPEAIDNSEWTDVIDALVKYNGIPYDDLFDLSNSKKISCVELVLLALRSDETYYEDFKNLERMIEEEGNLLPLMYKNCSDFTVAYETKR